MAQGKGGRPTKYNPELAERMMIEIASGMSVKRLCEEHDWTPDKKTFYTWMFKHPEFLHKYEEAKAAQMMWAAEHIEEIADSATNETIQVDKLRVDARKWTASRLLPRKYGDRQQLDHTSGGEPISGVGWEVIKPNETELQSS